MLTWPRRKKERETIDKIIMTVKCIFVQQAQYIGRKQLFFT